MLSRSSLFVAIVVLLCQSFLSRADQNVLTSPVGGKLVTVEPNRNITALDPFSPDTYNHRYDDINGIKYHYVDEGPKDGPVVVLLHGFPDLWYGWRHQIKFLTARGYRVICPDLRGYGETSSPLSPPNDIRSYGLKNISNDIIEILDKNNIGKFVLIGHDWGGFLAWRVYLHHPERVLGVASFCTPYIPPQKTFYKPEQIVKMVPTMAYQLIFAKLETVKYFDANVGLALRSIFRCNKPEDDALGFLKHTLLLPQDAGLSQPKPDNIMSEKELQYYIDTYTKAGFYGGLSWYRTLRVIFEEEIDLPTTIDVPSMMVTAGQDTILLPILTIHMPLYIPNLKRAHIENGTHWVLMEEPDLSNKYIAEFLDSLKLEV
ncbi:hypothetical protein K7432_000235 [Basidiobolus ranarum]|uniref:AB hydrolase-1 domain-containing protein n=1 Tax=Basidiobolus ranarum TaxID=34480 RepID=A0ABR2WBM0_9FUNG